jgi:hypothetical protein
MFVRHIDIEESQKETESLFIIEDLEVNFRSNCILWSYCNSSI